MAKSWPSTLTTVEKRSTATQIVVFCLVFIVDLHTEEIEFPDN